ncbi:hypothetical protein GFPCMMHI_05007 [Ensifer adhaerens]|nr:hypothetical protein [Ensifer adhaerens]
MRVGVVGVQISTDLGVVVERRGSAVDRMGDRHIVLDTNRQRTRSLVAITIGDREVECQGQGLFVDLRGRMRERRTSRKRVGAVGIDGQRGNGLMMRAAGHPGRAAVGDRRFAPDHGFLMRDAIRIGIDRGQLRQIRMSNRDPLEPICAHVEQAARCAADAVVFVGLVGIAPGEHILVNEAISRSIIGDREAVGDVERQRARCLVAVTIGDFKADLEILVVGALVVSKGAGLDIGVAAVGMDG